MYLRAREPPLESTRGRSAALRSVLFLQSVLGWIGKPTSSAKLADVRLGFRLGFRLGRPSRNL
eukprot:2151387-Rhodomonas_salina.1